MLLRILKKINARLKRGYKRFAPKWIQVEVTRIRRSPNGKSRFTPQDSLSYFILNIVNHCNLRCQSCDHFACIADAHLVSLDSIRHDLNRLGEILQSPPKRIGVMGGEPLLHPDLVEILRMTREAFAESKIDLTTNGILLLQQKQEFWDCCRQNRITISATRYQIATDYDKIQQVAEEQGVDFQFYGSSGESLKYSYKKPMDLVGKQNVKTAFAYCTQANRCVFLMEGKFYPCTVAGCIGHFNKKFGTDLQISDQDYLVLDEIQSERELLEFFARPIPFCRYCKTKEMKMGIPWTTTKASIHEWI